jgi:hypothetical protein
MLFRPDKKPAFLPASPLIPDAVSAFLAAAAPAPLLAAPGKAAVPPPGPVHYGDARDGNHQIAELRIRQWVLQQEAYAKRTRQNTFGMGPPGA